MSVTSIATPPVQDSDPVEASPAIWRPAGPRVLRNVVVKRINPRLRDAYGHWWIELDGQESYGWWPARRLTLPRLLLGTTGTLNGMGRQSHAGTPTRDPYHAAAADHRFSPTLVVEKSDEQVRSEIRSFATAYRGGWRWQWWWSRNTARHCRTFQQELFDFVGIEEDRCLRYTHGPGCPLLFPLRRIGWQLVDAMSALRGRMLSRLNRGV